MEIFEILKVFHIFCACMMFGATLVNGWLHLLAKRANASEAATLTRAIMSINHALMAPSLILLPITGVALLTMAGYAAKDLWIALSLILTLVIGLAFLIGIRSEKALCEIAGHAALTRAKILPQQYHKAFKTTAPIGAIATIGSISILWLMVAKPS